MYYMNCRANGTTTCMNIYDRTLRDTYPACGMNWPPIIGAYYKYLKVMHNANFAEKRCSKST